MIESKSDAANVLSARRFEIVGDDGDVQAVLEATPRGPRFEMRTGDTPVMRIEVYGDNGALLELLEPGGGLRVAVHGNPESGGIHFYGPGHDQEDGAIITAPLGTGRRGPAFWRAHADAAERKQRERVELRGYEDGAHLYLYGADGDLGNPLAGLTTHGRDAALSLDAVHAYDATDAPLPSPSLDLSSSVDGGGRLAIYDEHTSLVHEVPETIEGFTQRLGERLVKATADAVAAEGREITSSDLLEACCYASDNAQGAVCRLVTERAEGAERASSGLQ